MSIYTSERVLPYVYMCIHKITGRFYIGSRANSRQKYPSHLDFPLYKTSSKYVKPIFDEFDWCIIAEFFTKEDAYTFEQELIYSYKNNKNLINKICFHLSKNKLTFIGKSRLCYTWTEESKLKASNSHKGKKLTPTQLAAVSKPKSDSHKLKLKESANNRNTDNYKSMMSAATSYYYDVITPSGVVLENITLTDLSKNFNLNRDSLNWSTNPKRITPDGKFKYKEFTLYLNMSF